MNPIDFNLNLVTKTGCLYYCSITNIKLNVQNIHGYANNRLVLIHFCSSYQHSFELEYLEK